MEPDAWNAPLRNALRQQICCTIRGFTAWASSAEDEFSPIIFVAWRIRSASSCRLTTTAYETLFFATFLLTEISVFILNVFSINVKTFLATRTFSVWIFIPQRSNRLITTVPHSPIKAASSAILQCLAGLIFFASSSLTFPENDISITFLYPARQLAVIFVL